jgi:hypothetical protein
VAESSHSLVEAAKALDKFARNDLTQRIAKLEDLYCNANAEKCMAANQAQAIDTSLLTFALLFKQTAGQLNVIIHAAGILLSLPYVLEKGEYVHSLSLGAGNTGKLFDLVTSLSIAEFKFIQWRGADTVRQNSLFKDFYLLAEANTDKRRKLYVVDDTLPLKFFRSGRNIMSAMSQHSRLGAQFQKRYGDRFTRVCEYYEYRRELVTVIDLKKIVPFPLIFSEDAMPSLQ